MMEFAAGAVFGVYVVIIVCAAADWIDRSTYNG
jgi:hypothetical protein